MKGRGKQAAAPEARRRGRRPPKRRRQTAAATPAFPIVGIGASAGGFEAFHHLLAALPPRPGLALVFVQHLAPQQASSLPALLGGYTPLPVTAVVQGVTVQRDHVYVVPPNAQMKLVDGHLRLTPRPADRSRFTPIDYFFRSLARTLRNRAVGVVLSGTASDGADGLRQIKAAGGIALAQDPGTTQYDGMPRAAIATGVVDLVLPPEQIALKLAEIAANPGLAPALTRAPGGPAEEVQVTPEQFDRICRLLLPAGGVDFLHYKSATIVRRLLRRMALLKLDGVEAYIAHLEQQPAEVLKLHSDLLIHVTRFFREPESFRVLGRDIVPDLLKKQTREIPLRAWVAGCATGEEAYSLAIVLLEALGDRDADQRVQIFGTDVSEGAIQFARHGLYPPSIRADVSPERLQRFFVKSDGGYRVTRAVRDLLCLRAAGSHARSAVLASRSDLLPQRAHLSGRQPAAAAAVLFPLRAQARRHPPARPVGNHRSLR